MSPNDANVWKSDLFDEILRAFAADSELRKSLIFKGARILALHLGEGRQSLDLDSNMSLDFVSNHRTPADQEQTLASLVETALARHFRRQNPQRYAVKSVKVQRRLPLGHPMGWDAMNLKIQVEDFQRRNVRGLPTLEIDVSSPESLFADSIQSLPLGSDTIQAYSLPRIAGEKLRAFLSSLPAYRRKVRKPGESVRVKDLYDLARIRRKYGFDQTSFWEQVGREFRLACQSRYVDCAGEETFTENRDVTEKTYREDPTIPKDISWEETHSVLVETTGFFLSRQVIPFAFPIP